MYKIVTAKNHKRAHEVVDFLAQNGIKAATSVDFAKHSFEDFETLPNDIYVDEAEAEKAVKLVKEKFV